MRDLILVTGGAGFIGANFILQWLQTAGSPVVNLDRLTYAGNPANLASLRDDSRYHFVHGDIGDAALVASLLRAHQPRALVHFAAESHVDRSIHSPAAFLRTNVEGACVLLEQARLYWSALPPADRAAFRFLNISTDEIYGSLDPAAPPFTETAPAAPNSPYAASKVAAAAFARAYFHTWNLPVLTTVCSNNYGPFQFPEKLIPLVLLNALHGRPLPVYGDGRHLRDWLFVDDHCAALRAVLRHGRPGQTYNIGGNCPRANLDVVTALCDLLDEMAPPLPTGPRRSLITFVADRPGHDRRYALDSSKIARELGWQPTVSFDHGLRRTVRWYLDHPDWIETTCNPSHLDWLARHYGSRSAS